jgi:NAD(P)-dependent dehydrogenase (short-subunit alcohol dehydrogenase family)
MGGLVIFTGANSSLAIPAAEHLLQNYPDYTVVFTVRDASDSYPTTKLLRDTMAKYPAAKATITQLDLASLDATHEFADGIVADIQGNKYPSLDAIVCNAYYWNLVGDPELTEDGFDKTFQVTHLSHAALVLKLLPRFGHNGGRVVLLSSDCHWPGKNAMEVYPPVIPDDLDLLVRPTCDDDKLGRGYQRYAIAKLAVTAWMYALNRRLEKVWYRTCSPRCVYTDLQSFRIQTSAKSPPSPSTLAAWSTHVVSYSTRLKVCTINRHFSSNRFCHF